MVDVSAVFDSGCWEKILDDNDKLTWIVVGLEEGSKKKVIVQHQGSGDLAEVVSKLDETQVQFGALRVTAIDVKGKVTSTRAKLVSFCWVGPKAKARLRLQLAGKVQPYFKGSHVTFNLMDGDELTQELVEAKLLEVGGAHKPHKFHFGFFESSNARSPKVRSAKAAEPAAAAAPAPAPAVAAAPAPAPAAAAEPEPEPAKEEEKAAPEPEPEAAKEEEEKEAAPEPEPEAAKEEEEKEAAPEPEPEAAKEAEEAAPEPEAAKEAEEEAAPAAEEAAPATEEEAAPAAEEAAPATEEEAAPAAEEEAAAPAAEEEAAPADE